MGHKRPTWGYSARILSGLIAPVLLAGCTPRAGVRTPQANVVESTVESTPAAPPPAVAPFDARQAHDFQDRWARHLRQPIEIDNSIGLKLALIPPGEFMMGSPPTEADRDPVGETPHRARITRPFYMAIDLVTQDEFDRVMGYNTSYRAARMARSKQNYDVDTSRFPVERVAWMEAVEFCRRLSALPEEKAAGRVYRLPTEAEWEYACRAGTTTPFFCGNILDGRQANMDGNQPYGTDKRGPYLNRPSTVGSYPANAFGLFDMAGNMWEWCADRHARDYYAHAPVDDPTGPAEGTERVIRGGAWRYPGAYCRSAVRYHYDPRIRAYDLGFRVALTVPAAPARSSVADNNPPARSPANEKPAHEPEGSARAPSTNPAAPTRGVDWTSPSTGMKFVWVRDLGIWVGQYDVTNGQYRQMDPAHDSGVFLKQSLNGDRQPVARVSFDDAKGYAKWLSARDRGVLPEDCGYRLPTEKEWLTFARCGRDVEFPWGNQWPPPVGNYRGQEAVGRGDKIAGYRDPYPVACDVELSGCNQWGLYGTGGNVWQACASDPSGEEVGSWRGGSWDSGTPGLLRCRFRSVGMPSARFPNYGFRLVLSPK